MKLNNVQIRARESVAEQRIETLNDFDKISQLPIRYSAIPAEAQKVLDTTPDEELFPHLNQLILMYSSVVVPAITALLGRELPKTDGMPQYNERFAAIDDFIIGYLQKWMGINVKDGAVVDLDTKRFFDFTKETLNTFVPDDTPDVFFVYSFDTNHFIAGDKVFGSWAKALLKIAGFSLTKGMKERLMSDQVDLGRKVDAREINAKYLTAKNGDIKLFDDYGIVKHDPSHLTTRAIPVGLVPGDTSATDRMLANTFPDDPETVNAVWYMWGSEFDNNVPKPTAYFLYGRGANNKSGVLRIGRNLVGLKNVSGAALSDLSGRFGMGAIVDPVSHQVAMLISSDENRHTKSNSENTVLDLNNAKLLLSDGGYILVNPKGKQQFSVNLDNNSVSIQQSMNTIPDTVESTYAVERRTRAIPFNVTFSEENGNIDPRMKINIDNEMDAVAYKAWDIYRKKKISGVLEAPESETMRIFKDEFLSKRPAPSIVAQFIEQHIEGDPSGRELKHDIVTALETFATETNQSIGRFVGKSLWQEWRRSSPIPFIDGSSNGDGYVLGVRIK